MIHKVPRIKYASVAFSLDPKIYNEQLLLAFNQHKTSGKSFDVDSSCSPCVKILLPLPPWDTRRAPTISLNISENLNAISNSFGTCLQSIIMMMMNIEE